MEWFFIVWFLWRTDVVTRQEVTAPTWALCEAQRTAFREEEPPDGVVGRIWTTCTQRTR